MSKRAVILAGGRGVRLRPYTLTLPKPMMPLGDVPILEIIIQQLAAQGFTRLTLAVNHQAEVIQQYFDNGDRWGVEIDYSLEQQPLGTLGPVLQIQDLPDDFLVMNADVLTDFSFADCWEQHMEQGAALTVGICEREYQRDYGVVMLDEDERMVAFEEKPVRKEWISMGIYMVSKSVLEGCVRGERMGFDALFRKLIDLGTPPDVYIHEGYWLDIGSPADYLEAVKVFSEQKPNFLPQLK